MSRSLHATESTSPSSPIAIVAQLRRKITPFTDILGMGASVLIRFYVPEIFSDKAFSYAVCLFKGIFIGMFC